jgi:alkylhydroperoxidase/carboxymuconolactone decarboxylase family protein YurZ
MSYGKAVQEELRVPSRELRHATPAEAAEAIGVTFLMNGGPATVYGARAFAAFREFYAERAAQPDAQQPAAR